MILLASSAMGTRFEIALEGGDEVWLRAVGEEALREVEWWHSRLSRFEADSDTSRLVREPSSRVDVEMQGLLELCEGVRVASGGAFDVRMPIQGRSTEFTEIVAEKTEGEQERVGTAAGLDFGAVGKGWALDRAAAVLREHGVQRALLHGGTSSVVAIGSPPCQPELDGWRIDVRSDGEMLPVVLRDRVMGVSAPRGKLDAEGAGHIVDPRTGRPVAEVDTAVVIAPLSVENGAALCDAWSTALVVLGEIPSGFPDGFEAHWHTKRGWESHAAGVMGAA